MTRISALASLASADPTDVFPIVDVSATTTKKITKTAFLSDVVNGTLMANQSILAKNVNLSVADQTARDAISSPWEGLEVYRRDVDRTEIYDGAAWRRQAQWEELGSTSGTTLSLTSLPARKHLHIRALIRPSGGTIFPGLRFNNDSATNYADQSSYNGAAYGVNVSTTRIPAGAGSAAEQYGQFILVDIDNYSTEFKNVDVTVLDAFGTNATTSLNFATTKSKWASLSQISRIDFINITGTGTFLAASEFTVFGRD